MAAKHLAVVCEGLGLTECRVSCAPICRTPVHRIPPLSIALEAATTARLALSVSEKAWLSLQSLWTNRSLCSSSVLGLLLEFVGGLFVLFTDFVELSHVLEEVGASLESDEKLGLLAIASVVGGLNCDGLGSDFLECCVIVPIKSTRKVSLQSQKAMMCAIHQEILTSNKPLPTSASMAEIKTKAPLRSDSNMNYLSVEVWLDEWCTYEKELEKPVVGRREKKRVTYLTRFSEAMTLVETALPRACNSIVSCVSKYFFPRKT